MGVGTDPEPAALVQAKEKVAGLKKKKKEDPALSIQNIIKLDPDTISQRLIESVQMVRELLQSNR